MVKGRLFTHLEKLDFRLVADRDTQRGAGLALLSQPRKCRVANCSLRTVQVSLTDEAGRL
jgi:hypothetical protein